MTRTLAILATAATLGATTMAAPAEARGIGPRAAHYYGPAPCAYGSYIYYDGPYYYRHHYWCHW